jgi:hypothetical protein
MVHGRRLSRGIEGQAMKIRALLFLLLWMVPTTAVAQRCPDKLPPVVEAKRQAIIAAAKARDLPALAKLVDSGPFTYSFGDEQGDPLPYWQQSLKERIDIPHYIAAIFAMRCGVMVESGAFLFPVSSAMDWKDLTAAEKKEMEALYGREIDQWFLEGREKGYYVGWRGVIEKNGAWTSFVAGD